MFLHAKHQFRLSVITIYCESRKQTRTTGPAAKLAIACFQ